MRFKRLPQLTCHFPLDSEDICFLLGDPKPNAPTAHRPPSMGRILS